MHHKQRGKEPHYGCKTIGCVEMAIGFTLLIETFIKKKYKFLINKKYLNYLIDH